MQIYRSVINEEETRTGIQSTRPLDVTFNEALADQETLALFIKRTCLRTLLMSQHGLTVIVHLRITQIFNPYGP